MPLQIIHGDITKMQVDAIVNAANRTLLGGGGVDGSIHRAAGRELYQECRSLGGCETGSAKVTGGYALPCKYVIHAVGPVWRGGNCSEKLLLQDAYRTSLELARERNCETVAFPLISSGAYGYPKAQALQVAVDTIAEFLQENDMTVYLMVYDRASFEIDEALCEGVAGYVDARYSPLQLGRPTMRRMRLPRQPAMAQIALDADGDLGSLEQELEQIDESFTETLLRMIDEKGMTDAQCYKKANIDRKLFSKIRSDRLYRPSKPTAMAFAIALELSLPQARELLQKAGFAFSRSSKFDIIVEYFIRRKEYDIFRINEALFAFDQSLLGG